MRIRKDFEGVTFVYVDAAPVMLKAGDKVPEGAEVGAHLLDSAKPDESGGMADEPTDLSKLTIPKLKEYAAEHGIDLGGATKKDDILAVIAAVSQPVEPVQNDDAAGDVQN